MAERPAGQREWGEMESPTCDITWQKQGLHKAEYPRGKERAAVLLGSSSRQRRWPPVHGDPMGSRGGVTMGTEKMTTVSLSELEALEQCFSTYGSRPLGGSNDPFHGWNDPFTGVTQDGQKTQISTL